MSSYQQTDGTVNNPFYTIQSSSGSGGNQLAFSTDSIATSNTYQQIVAAGGAKNGGIIENTSGVGGGTIYIDFTYGVTAGGTSLSNGAMTVGPALTTGQAGGKQSIPPTSNAVFVYGPSGATFRGYSS